jgi:hypothetical protein
MNASNGWRLRSPCCHQSLMVLHSWTACPFYSFVLCIQSQRGRAHSYGHDLTRELQLIGFNNDRAAAQLGVSPSSELGGRSSSQDTQARSSATAGACGNETHLRSGR